MEATVQKLTDVSVLRRACEMTLRPGLTSKASLRKLYQTEHSPIRTQMFWVELTNVPTFVSVHFVRHKVGVEHFVQSNRDDRGGAGDTVVNRLTPVNHGMLLNAATLIQMSLKRLCLVSHKKTVEAMSRIRKAVRDQDPDLAHFMVPACVYRNGICPEIKPCTAGPERVCAAYAKMRERTNG